MLFFRVAQYRSVDRSTPFFFCKFRLANGVFSCVKVKYEIGRIGSFPSFSASCYIQWFVIWYFHSLIWYLLSRIELAALLCFIVSD